MFLDFSRAIGYTDLRLRRCILNMIGYEIEHKYLIRYPDPDLLRRFASPSEIVQTYLLGEKGTTERVRRRSRNGQFEYTHTIKRKISPLRRIEDETEIGPNEYERLLERADPERRPVHKKRYCFTEAGHLWEIDVYPFWTDRAIMEVELTDEAEEITLPRRIRILREVSNDKRYTNASISREIPKD